MFDFKTTGATYPFGAHVAVVEIDSETGSVRVRVESGVVN